jgi:lysophospholipase L1-like esterase
MYEATVTVLAILLLLFSCFLFIKCGYFAKLLFKLGIKDCGEPRNWTAFSWESSLQKSSSKAEIVFLGDSITRGGQFQEAFPHCTIMNLGISGDTLEGMRKRISTVQLLNPKAVFILGGINGLTDYNLKLNVIRYVRLIKELQIALPSAQLYVQSVLPISKKQERKVCHNCTIQQFNKELRLLAENENIQFVDLFELFFKDGELDIQATTDGIHLAPDAYERWFAMLKPYITI